jgi:hypothetical protein
MTGSLVGEKVISLEGFSHSVEARWEIVTRGFHLGALFFLKNRRF